MSAAPSANGAAGSRPLTRFALTTRPPDQDRGSTRWRRAPAPARDRAPRPARGNELDQRRVQAFEPLRLDERRQCRVRFELLGPEPLDEGDDPGPVRSGQLRGEARERRDRNVAVAALAKRVGDRLHLLEGAPLKAPREARSKDLERRAQPPGGDAHVVHPLDVDGVEHPVGVGDELGGAGLDDRRAGLRKSRLRGDPFDLPILRHRRPSL